MTTKALYLITFLVTVSSAQAQCIKPPIRPDPGALVASGYSAADLRRHYQAYFNETENYLNCVNSESGRVRVEAKRASEEYGRVLRRYPLKPGETVERPQRGEVVSSSGVLPPLDPGEY